MSSILKSFVIDSKIFLSFSGSILSPDSAKLCMHVSSVPLNFNIISIGVIFCSKYNASSSLLGNPSIKTVFDSQFAMLWTNNEVNNSLGIFSSFDLYSFKFLPISDSDEISFSIMLFIQIFEYLNSLETFSIWAPFSLPGKPMQNIKW